MVLVEGEGNEKGGGGQDVGVGPTESHSEEGEHSPDSGLVWVPVETKAGRVYYFNALTEETTWEKPK